MRAYGLRNPVCVIPNGVDPPGDDDGTPAPWNGAVPEGRRVLLYLGRLHPKKGLPQLLRAWKLAQKDSPEALSWDLAFVGWDQNRHLHALQQLAQEMEIRVHFLGPQFGKAREAACRQANAFILPSLSEGLPMVVLEAWAHGKPVLMTPQCNLPEGFAAKAAIEISADTHGIARGLQTLFSMNQRDLGSMGAKGRTLAAERFAWPKIAADTRAVYAWLLGDAGKPACVIDA
jgi:poly(glycerol-phosphate) alpha-glucosyltransferase